MGYGIGNIGDAITPGGQRDQYRYGIQIKLGQAIVKCSKIYSNSIIALPILLVKLFKITVL